MSVLRRLLAGVFVCAAVGCAGTAPPIDTAGMEPSVRELIEARRAELNAAPSADAWGALGDALLAHGLDAQAGGCYARAAELSDEPFEWLYLQALAAQGEREIVLLRRALELKPQHPLVELRLALALQQLSRHAEAAEWFRAAAHHDPALSRAWRGLGRSRLALGRLAEAVDALQRAVALEPNDAAAWSALAQAYAAAGDDERAAFAVRRARASGERAGFRDEIWQRHVVRTGVSVSRLFERARLALGASDTDAARDHVEAILASRPDDADAHYLLGVVEAGSANARAAAAHFDRALELDPGHVRALLDRAALDEQAGRLESARERIERASALTPEDPAIVFALANNRRLADDLDGVLEAVTKLAQMRPDSAAVHDLHGQALEVAGRTELAIEAYRRAISLDPDSPAAARLQALDR